jgi:phosphatidylserine decarboxylase
MKLHKEGTATIALFTILLALSTALISLLPNLQMVTIPVTIILMLALLIVLWFFRIPVKNIVVNPNHILAPADGKVVVIEEVFEPEYFKDRRIQVSIFMSPLNVHNNINPVSGLVSFFKYHPGKFLVAWDPKSSTDNERTTVVVKATQGPEILFRQIAGALARRIVWYVKEGDAVQQGSEFGFIKFGSRVDLFLPLGTEVLVKLGDTPTGGETVVAKLA